MQKLELKEKIKLEAHKEKISNLILTWGGGLFALLFIVSFIPMGLLPRKRRLSVSDPSLSIFDSMGVAPTLLMLFLIAGALSVYLYHSFKYAKISKDVIEQEKITLEVKVVNVIYKQGGGPQEIDLFFSPPYNSVHKVEFVDERNFPRLHKNQEIKLVLTKNALYPLSIQPKDEIENILNILKGLK